MRHGNFQGRVINDLTQSRQDAKPTQPQARDNEKTINHTFDTDFNQDLTKIDQQPHFLVGKSDMCEQLFQMLPLADFAPLRENNAS